MAAPARAQPTAEHEVPGSEHEPSAREILSEPAPTRPRFSEISSTVLAGPASPAPAAAVRGTRWNRLKTARTTSTMRNTQRGGECVRAGSSSGTAVGSFTAGGDPVCAACARPRHIGARAHPGIRMTDCARRPTAPLQNRFTDAILGDCTVWLVCRRRSSSPISAGQPDHSPDLRIIESRRPNEYPAPTFGTRSAALLTVRRRREKRQGTDVSPAERIFTPLLFTAAFAALRYSILVDPRTRSAGGTAPCGRFSSTSIR